MLQHVLGSASRRLHCCARTGESRVRFRPVFTRSGILLSVAAAQWPTDTSRFVLAI
jgi:hypothetical protein